MHVDESVDMCQKIIALTDNGLKFCSGNRSF